VFLLLPFRISKRDKTHRRDTSSVRQHDLPDCSAYIYISTHKVHAWESQRYAKRVAQRAQKPGVYARSGPCGLMVRTSPPDTVSNTSKRRTPRTRSILSYLQTPPIEVTTKRRSKSGKELRCGRCVYTAVPV